jgi:hypothetical protein
MGKKQTQRMLVIAGFAAIGIIVAAMVFLQVASAKNAAFKQGWDSIAFDTISLTREYQAEEGKWRAKQYDNNAMAGIVDRYLPKYQALIDRANALDTPERYVQARDLLVKAIDTEKQSNEHFREFLVTGDQSEYERSIDLFSLSLQYSADADAAIKAAG